MKITVRQLMNSDLFFYSIFLSFCKPDCIRYLMPSLNHIWNYWKYFCYFVIFVIYLFSFSKKRLIHLDLLVFFMYRLIHILISGLVMSGRISVIDVLHILMNFFVILFISVSLEINLNKTFDRLFYILAVLTLINALSIILFPQGLYVANDVVGNYFLGYDNGHIIVILPAICLSLVNLINKKNMCLSLITIGFGGVSIVKCFSLTTIIGMLTFVLLVLVRFFPGVGKKLVNKYTVSCFVLTIFFGIILFRLHEQVFDLLLSWTKKDITFSGRTYLWDISLDLFKKSPVFGIGDDSEVIGEIIHDSTLLGNQKITFAHNEILDILVRNGIVGAIIYALIILNTLKKTKIRNSVVDVFICGLGGLWTMMMFESYFNYDFYLFYLAMILMIRYNYRMEKVIKLNKVYNGVCIYENIANNAKVF
ncbi:O-antigen ligase [Lachnospiraceae bacterium NE2001]|nr:O-antigen ligase [Lachnospiraceae bacterium NE2001]